MRVGEPPMSQGPPPPQPSPNGGGGNAQVHAYLLLLPAFLLLVAFTHFPAVASLIDSFYSTPKGARPAVWVGLDNYQQMAGDPVFWKALNNNLWFALATIPLSIGLALVMALWVNERMAGRGFLRMAEKVPTRCAFDRRGLAQARVQTLQGGEVEDHEEAGLLPHRHHRHGAERGALVAEPVLRRQTEQAGDLLEQAVARRVEEEPDVGHGHHRQHRRREIGHAQKAASCHALVDTERHQQRQADRQRDGGQREPEVVVQRLPEHRVAGHLPVVVQADPDGGTQTLWSRVEAVDQRSDGREVREGHQQDEGRQQQQVRVHLRLAPSPSGRGLG